MLAGVDAHRVRFVLDVLEALAVVSFAYQEVGLRVRQGAREILLELSLVVDGRGLFLYLHLIILAYFSIHLFVK